MSCPAASFVGGWRASFVGGRELSTFPCKLCHNFSMFTGGFGFFLIGISSGECFEISPFCWYLPSCILVLLRCCDENDGFGKFFGSGGVILGAGLGTNFFAAEAKGELSFETEPEVLRPVGCPGFL